MRNLSIGRSSAQQLRGVSKTLFIPLFFRAQETKEEGLIKDNAAVEIIDDLDFDFTRMSNDRLTQLLITLRTLIIDQLTENYINSTKSPVIVNLGAGLDTRELRQDEAKWYHLDLELPYNLREAYFGNSSKNISTDILDFSWVDEIEERENVFFIIEGVLMYLEEEKVKALLKTIAKNFKNSYVAFDSLPARYLKLDFHPSIDLTQSPFKWAISGLSEVESWGYNLTSVFEHSYLAEYENNKEQLNKRYDVPEIDPNLKVGLMKTK